MSLFSDLVSGADGVYSITNRPDLVAETALAVRQATLAAHRSDYYKKDIVEVITPSASPAQSIYQLDIPTLFPNWRNFAYIRPYDSVTQSPVNFLLEPIAPAGIFDEYLIEKTGVYYTAGTNLNIRLAAAIDSFIVGYYANPVLTPEGSYESWIARQQPAVIVLDAAKRIFEMIGYIEAANKLAVMLFGPPPGTAQAPTGGEYQLLKMTEIEDHGR
jgi:hypothetical protein